MKRYVSTRVLAVSLLIWTVALLHGCGDGSTQLHKQLIDTALNHQSGGARIEALWALEKMMLTNSSFDAIVRVMRNDEESRVRMTAEGVLWRTAEGSTKWKLACAKALAKAVEDGKIQDASYRYKNFLWEIKNPEKSARLKAEIEKRVDPIRRSGRGPELWAAQARMNELASKAASYRDSAAFRVLLDKEYEVRKKVRNELWDLDQKRPASEQKYRYGLDSVTDDVDADPRAVAVLEEKMRPVRQAKEAKEAYDDLSRQAEKSDAKANQLDTELYGRDFERLYREWFEK